MANTDKWYDCGDIGILMYAVIKRYSSFRDLLEIS